MTNLNRRSLLQTALAVPVAGAAFFHPALGALPDDTTGKAGPAPTVPPVSLHSLALAKGMGFGTCLGTKAGPGSRALDGAHSHSFEDARVRAISAAECGLLVPENELKWYVLRPDAQTFDFERADRLATFAGANHMAMRGHTLLWNYPKWMQPWEINYDFGAHPVAEAERMLREHIGKVCGHYGRKIFSYDVINESIDPKTGNLRDTGYSRHLGDRLFDVAFHAAREAAPHAELVYNDFMTWMTGNEKHYAGVLRILEHMRKNNVPVDALGIQSHIGTRTEGPDGFPALDEKGWRKFLDEVTAMGYGLIITEFDLEDKLLSADVAKRDAEAAAFTRSYFDMLLSYKQTRYVMAWGMVDSYSWLRDYSPRADGLPKRPSLYDDAMKPKPIREAIAAAFRAAPTRPPMKFG